MNLIVMLLSSPKMVSGKKAKNTFEKTIPKPSFSMSKVSL